MERVKEDELHEGADSQKAEAHPQSEHESHPGSAKGREGNPRDGQTQEEAQHASGPEEKVFQTHYDSSLNE